MGDTKTVLGFALGQNTRAYDFTKPVKNTTNVFWTGAFDKNEGVVKAHLSRAVFLAPRSCQRSEEPKL